jgi:hypothetical protein
MLGGVLCERGVEDAGRGVEGTLGVKLDVTSTSMTPVPLSLSFIVAAELSVTGELERQGEVEAVLRSKRGTESPAGRPLGESTDRSR